MKILTGIFREQDDGQFFIISSVNKAVHWLTFPDTTNTWSLCNLEGALVEVVGIHVDDKFLVDKIYELD